MASTMKQIRVDYYRYRLRKGSADILLQLNDDGYCIPYRYVQAVEHIAWTIRHNYVEDDSNGDLVIIDHTLNDCHLKKNDKEWIPLGNIMDIDFPRNESYHIYHNILRIFMLLCPTDGELGLRRKVSDMMEVVKVNIAKKDYIDTLKRALERKEWVIPDAQMTPPDPELIKREIETLEHFRLYKPHEIPMNQVDGMLLVENRYSFEPIDWEVFGAEIKPFPMFPFGRNSNPLLDELENLEEE